MLNGDSCALDLSECEIDNQNEVSPAILQHSNDKF